jgi:hypothetical protein
MKDLTLRSHSIEHRRDEPRTRCPKAAGGDRLIGFEPGHRTIEQLLDITTHYRLSLPAAKRSGRYRWTQR